MPAVVPPRPPIKKKPKPINASKVAKKSSSGKNSYLDAIKKEQDAQRAALEKMWAKDKKRKTAQIRTK